MHDLLRDPLIGVCTTEGNLRASLPEVIARLLAGTMIDFTGLRPHQSDPWHVFLVQIAASVMARHPALSAPPLDETFWRDGLLDLANGRASAWELVVEDPTQPAFLQHPLRDSSELSMFKPKASSPDELDVLVTAKDHDVKIARIGADDAEAWLFALLAYQTTSGFLGAGNYGSIRMNGGFGSRAIVSLVVDTSASGRYCEELKTVVAMRRSAIASGVGFIDAGIALTWLQSWNREGSQISLTELEPWFIEAVRAVRLKRMPTGIIALGTTTRARQVGPGSMESGDIADPWTPINVADRKKGRSALTVSSSGWTPELITHLLFQHGFELTALQEPRPDMEGTVWFLGSVLVRGQGTTSGFHRFRLPVPAPARRRLLLSQERDRLGRCAEGLLLDAREVDGALRTALIALIGGGPEKIDFKKDTMVRWSSAVTSDYVEKWQDLFFPTLWRFAEEEESAVVVDWRSALIESARAVLRNAQMTVPLPTGRRYRALTAASGAFEGSIRKKGLLPERQALDREATS